MKIEATKKIPGEGFKSQPDFFRHLQPAWVLRPLQTATSAPSSVRSEIFVELYTKIYPAPSGRNMPLLTELESIPIAKLQRCRPAGALSRSAGL
jgi:hypothetical protein